MTKKFALLTAVLMLAGNLIAFAGAPQRMTVQGRLTDSNGDAIASESILLRFIIYDEEVGGLKVWPDPGLAESHSLTTDVNGLWTVDIGSALPMADSMFADTSLWLQVIVEGANVPTTAFPRVRLTSGPFAFRAATIDGATGGTITSKVTIGPDNTNSGAYAFVAGQNNGVSGDWSTISGGTFNTTGSAFSTVGGGSHNSASGGTSTVGGGFYNGAPGIYGTVGGGQVDTAAGNSSTVGGGSRNFARGAYSVVSGGGGNFPHDSNSAGGDYAMIPGGSRNVANGDHSFAAGLHARAVHNGAFVWADDLGMDFVSTRDKQFLVQASGGVGVGTNTTTDNILRISDQSAEQELLEAVRIESLNDPLPNADLLALHAPATPAEVFQFIEAELGTDVKFRAWSNGNVTADGTISGGGADFAEMVAASDGPHSVEPGDVMIIDAANHRSLKKSAGARSTLVAGICSGAPGFIASPHDWDKLAVEQGLTTSKSGSQEAASIPVLEVARAAGEIPLAVIGIVPCKVSAENGPISAGDLLVTSSMPGHAMRDESPKTGTVLGKALGSLDDGTGVIDVLVTLH